VGWGPVPAGSSVRILVPCDAFWVLPSRIFLYSSRPPRTCFSDAFSVFFFFFIWKRLPNVPPYFFFPLKSTLPGGLRYLVIVPDVFPPNNFPGSPLPCLLVLAVFHYVFNPRTPVLGFFSVSRLFGVFSSKPQLPHLHQCGSLPFIFPSE